MSKVLAFLLGALLCWPAWAQQVPHPAPMSLPATNAALKAINGSINLRAARLGFIAAGDGGYAEYNWSGTNCTAADDGAQVQPTGTGCWVADFSGRRTPGVWGAKCDGVTNDAVAINTAVTTIANAGGGALYFPKGTCIINAPILLKSNVKLVGEGHTSSIIAASSANMIMIDVVGSFSGFEGMMLKCGGIASFISTTNSCVTIRDNLSEILIRDFDILMPFIGIGIGNSVLVTMQDGYIYNPTPNTGVCIEVNGGNNQIIKNVLCRGSGPTTQNAVGLNLKATTGVWMYNFQTVHAGTGVYINPESGKEVTWIFDTNGAYDSGAGSGIAIAPSGTGSVRGYYCIGCWTATNEEHGVAVLKGASGVLDDVHLIGHRSYNNKQHGVVAAGMRNLVVQSSSICGNSAQGASLFDGINASNVTHMLLQGNVIGNCAGFDANAQTYGVNVSGALTSQISVTGNRLSGNSIGSGRLVDFDYTQAAVIKDNLGLDDQLNIVATAATVTLPLQPMVTFSGTTNVQNMIGGWQGRTVWILPQGVFDFVAGGALGTGIGNAFTTVANRPVLATFVGTAWYLH